MSSATATWFDLALKLVGGLAAMAAVLTAVAKALKWTYRRRKLRRAKRLLEADACAKSYSREQLRAASEYYVEPDCVPIVPSRRGETHLASETREPAFQAIERQLNDPRCKYFILLADSGMGKTAFVLNYYIRNRLLPDERRFRIAVVPLSAPDADAQIGAIPEPERTVLLLDSFDEDARAIDDYHRRITDLLQLAAKFAKLLITCRTQFFEKDDAIPQKTGAVRVGVLPLGERREYEFLRLYLQPLDDRQVTAYLDRRCPVWKNRRFRKRADALVSKIGDLAARPMLLTYLPELLNNEHREYGSAFEIYSELVENWFRREDSWFVGRESQIRAFSLDLALDLWKHRKLRGTEQIFHTELLTLIRKYGLTLVDPRLARSRLLLNRTGDGYFKFAHRTIMEYLVVCARLEGRPGSEYLDWSDQMLLFLRQALESKVPAQRASLQVADLRGCNLARANFAEADLSDAELDFSVLLASGLNSAKLSSAHMTESSLRMRFLYIPSGSVGMSGDAAVGLRQSHWVDVNPFWISESPITNGQFAVFVRATGYGCVNWTDRLLAHSSRGVATVDWSDAMAFCAWLSSVTGQLIVLPNEAQWEHVGRHINWSERACIDGNCVENRRNASGSKSRDFGARQFSSEHCRFGALAYVAGVAEWCVDIWSEYAIAKWPVASRIDTSECSAREWGRYSTRYRELTTYDDIIGAGILDSGGTKTPNPLSGFRCVVSPPLA